MSETDTENHGEIHSNIAATNPMFAKWQVLQNGNKTVKFISYL
jgi:hypothetical protein